MSRKPTSHDVARLASVSQATVSYVLSGRRDINITEPTRERVLRAARELHYRSNCAARSLVSGKSQAIGIIAPHGSVELQARFAHGVQQAALDLGYRVLIGYSHRCGHSATLPMEFLLEHQVEGVICIADDGTPDTMPEMVNMAECESIQIVIVNDRAFAGQSDCVFSDDHRGGRLSTEHLIDLGHKRIGYIGGGAYGTGALDRRNGYLSAMNEAGLEVDDEMIVNTSCIPPAGLRTAVHLMLRDARPTAVFAANDLLALIVRETALSLAFATPGDLAVVGYGNTQAADLMGLTSADQQPFTLGSSAAECLINRISNPALPVQQVTLSPRVVVRGSCGRDMEKEISFD